MEFEDFLYELHGTARAFKKSKDLARRTDNIVAKLHNAYKDIDFICKTGEWFYNDDEARDAWIKEKILDLDFAEVMLKMLLEKTWLRSSMSYENIVSKFYDLKGIPNPYDKNEMRGNLV